MQFEHCQGWRNKRSRHDWNVASHAGRFSTQRRINAAVNGANEVPKCPSEVSGTQKIMAKFSNLWWWTNFHQRSFNLDEIYELSCFSFDPGGGSLDGSITFKTKKQVYSCELEKPRRRFDPNKPRQKTLPPRKVCLKLRSRKYFIDFSASPWVSEAAFASNSRHCWPPFSDVSQRRKAPSLNI